MYLCLMKHKIETRCSILEIQLSPERKFSHLNFASLFVDFDYAVVNRVLCRSFAYIIFQVCPTPNLHVEC